MYENGLITQRRHEVQVGNLRESLVFEIPLRLQCTVSDKVIQPDWQIMDYQVSDVETLVDGETQIYRVNWQVTVRSNTQPYRELRITVTLYDAQGEIIQQAVIDDNPLPRWETEDYSGFISLTAEERDRFASYTLNVTCTAGCGAFSE